MLRARVQTTVLFAMATAFARGASAPPDPTPPLAAGQVLTTNATIRYIDAGPLVFVDSIAAR